MKAVILAAGKSSRFKPLSDKRHKALTEVMGKPLIQHTIDALRDTEVEEIIVVQGPEREIEDSGVDADRFVVQEEPKGMGNALQQAEKYLENRFLVLTPYRSKASELYQPMIDKAEENDTETIFVASETENPEKYGILDIENGKVSDIVEKPDLEEAPSNMKAVGMYMLSKDFFNYLNNTQTKEYQYEEALSNQMKDKKASFVEAEEDPNSIKYPWDLFEVMKELLDNSERSISGEAEIADSAEVKGKVIVEEGAKIFENAVVKGPAYIGEDAVVGNNALIRNYSCIERGTTVGANCEARNTSFQPESSMHSQFVGDSIIGRNTSIGAGTVIANRNFREDGERPEISTDLIGKDYSKETGRNSLGCFIGENVDIGVNSSIMPGVQIGSDSKIGPGTVVKENVENDTTVYSSQEVEKK
ncbi:bifunctional sugar-1-phosphate nucleotidylyltransferase/acetyltransferase [Candidatus Nanohalobium constans]|uniref:Bifunctional UDP-N-acetylglucosamine pyrophosphorylase / Glucosamine-1-phosphate N-acetyltransferase n=1 Tax=Candidatus Nanohalobium constans TaxID=2565781 RepID=A0A5Q0UHB5_9ARCH|nr:bifunctional sugar-1-phosphate nucleotidylyltransferase/acetyltransferase [Candidatus Nanohalobium constans]QGA81017.1 bifunctional UDP-N-acetylglucosamine pyrophosphorylase / Glucosamine-1-phosphate N-acetyltransferase [Candidatus Nanohalobium constans]